MRAPNPRLITQKERKLFEAIVAEFPLAAISDGESTGVGFKDKAVEEINIAFFPMVNGKSWQINRSYTSFIVGRQPILDATRDPTKTLIITENLEDLIAATVGVLKKSISEKLEPDFDTFIKKATKGRGFSAPNRRPMGASVGRSTYLSVLASSTKLHDYLEILGAYANKSLAKIPGFIFVKKIANSNIPLLATELLALIEHSKNSSISDEALFKKLANEFYLSDKGVRSKGALFLEAVEFVKGVQEELHSISDYANPIAAIHHVMSTAAFIFIELPSTYTTSLVSTADYSSFRSKYPQGFAYRGPLPTPDWVKLNDLAGFALYAAEGLKQIQDKELPLIRSLVKEGVIKGIDINIFNRIEQSVRELHNFIRQSGIEEDFRNYRAAIDRSIAR